MSQLPDSDTDRPAAPGPRQFWRSLDELARTDEFEYQLHREFPVLASEWSETDEVGRREFLKVMGASLVLAGVGGVSGCVVQPPETIVPYVRQPEEVVPGEPIYYATAAPLGGFGVGVLVESHTGRPTKVEGNPQHPSSLGGTDVFAQAQVLTLYDPDRAQVVTRNGRVSTWDDFLNVLIDLRARLASKRGAGLRILTGTITSPSLARVLKALFDSEEFAEARWHQHDPVGQPNAAEGARLTLGQPSQTVLDPAGADVILALDADPLGWGPGRLAFARAFGNRRDADSTDGRGLTRLYAVESTPTITGACADHRWPARPSEIPALALAIAEAVGVEGLPAGDRASAPWIGAVADDLKAKNGRSLVVVGEAQPPAVHALGHAINAKLGNVGKTVKYKNPVVAVPEPDRGGTLRELAADLADGSVEVLVMLDGNPAYTAPADLNFGQILTDARKRGTQLIYQGLYPDETARKSGWLIPLAHFLETWGDIRGHDGTATIQQPLLEPLHDGLSPLTLIEALRTGEARRARDVVRETWRTALGFPAVDKADSMGEGGPAPDQAGVGPGGLADSNADPANADRLAADDPFEDLWREALRVGVVNEKSETDAGSPGPGSPSLADVDWPSTSAPGGIEIAFRPDPTIWDGQFANNGWLQELPKPLTRLTWDNAALLSPATAARLGINDGDGVDISYQGRTLRDVAALRLPGQPDDVVTLHLGYGRPAAGSVGNGNGWNAYDLRTTEAPWTGGAVELTRSGTSHLLAGVQMHHDMAGRDLVHVETIGLPGGGEHRVEQEKESKSEVQSGVAVEPGHTEHPHDPPTGLTIYEHPEPLQRRIDGFGNKWGMAIDLNQCIGCSACVVACQAENNIPVVGKAQVLAGREMHWIRIDRYYQTTDEYQPEAPIAANPRTYFQPVPCQHCENAPCELVCPVAATSHSAEGINEMTYNRCVGTRYCSNNCPYKVRRFNFFHYNDPKQPLRQMQFNPDVTVRFRGVMEKCNYCVQRVNGARIASEIRNEVRVPGDAVETACQGACPTRAISFGNLNDPGAAVVRKKASPRDYSLLAELNTRPRTTYLARVLNPNPALAE